MQLGKTLVGGIIGSVIGVILLVAVYFALNLDGMWLAIPFALLTGFGVRTLVSTSGHASYARGALTGLMALGIYLVGSYVVAGVAQSKAKAASKPSIVKSEPAEKPAADDSDAANADDAKDENADEAKPEPPKTPAKAGTNTAASDRTKGQVPKDFDPLNFVWLCVAALVAYELGRGTGAKTAVATTDEPPSGMAQGTHPDA